MTDQPYSTERADPVITLDDLATVLDLIRHTMKPKQVVRVACVLRRWAGTALPDNVVHLRGDAERRRRRMAMTYFADRMEISQ